MEGAMLRKAPINWRVGSCWEKDCSAEGGQAVGCESRRERQVEQLALENFHVIVKDIVDSVLVDII